MRRPGAERLFVTLAGATWLLAAGCSSSNSGSSTDAGEDGSKPTTDANTTSDSSTADSSTSDSSTSPDTGAYGGDGASSEASSSDAGEAGAPSEDAGDAGTTEDAGDAGAAKDAGDAGDAGGGDAGPALASLKHVVVIYLENHSFDNLFGSWPGADGLADGGAAIAQVGPDGGAYGTLPQYPADPAGVETLNTLAIGNAPFDLTAKGFEESALTNDLLHRFYQEQAQINGGKMDSYVLWNNESAGQSLGYWPTSTLPVPQWMQTHASSVTLLDHFFHAAFGGSFLNHFWLISAQSPTFPDAPSSIVATTNDAGQLTPILDTTSDPPSAVFTTSTDGQVTPDGFVVNTSYSVNEPHPPGYDNGTSSTAHLVPQQTYTTIADELDSADVTWAWYAGGWNVVLASEDITAVGTDAGSENVDGGTAEILNIFEYHHQPFVFFKNWGGTAATDGGIAGVGTVPNGKWALNHNLKDEEDFIAAATAGTLPSVSFVKPLFDEHPNYTTETQSEQNTVNDINAVVNGPEWSSTAIIITYDENGGEWDHVAPPKTDKWGPGTRIPAIVISPFAKGGVDSTTYDTTAILKLIEKRWSLAALSTRDAAQSDLSTNAMTFAP